LKYCGGAESVEWMIPKVLWIKRNQSDVYQKAYKIIEQLDWFNYKLTGGKLATSICQAACKWNYIDGHGGWQKDFFEQIGLEDYEDILVTDVKQVGEPLGKIDHEFAEKYDLNPEMQVIEGGIDAHIGMLGLGVSKPGRLAMIMGTSFVQLCFSKEEKELEGIWGPYLNPVVPGLNILEGGQISAGSIVKWYMKQWGFDKMDRPYEAIAEMLKSTKPGANGLVALDFFQGNRTPYKDPNAKGVIYGLTLSHTKADIYRALIESVAMGTKNIIDNFEKQGVPIDMIVGCGGVTKDKNWMQIIADATGKPIIVTVDPSAGGLGCCIVAAVGTQTYASFDEATEGMVKMAYTVEPNPDNYPAYEALFKRYTELYSHLKDMMNDEEE
jgi:ribulokinase